MSTFLLSYYSTFHDSTLQNIILNNVYFLLLAHKVSDTS